MRDRHREQSERWGVAMGRVVRSHTHNHCFIIIADGIDEKTINSIKAAVASELQLTLLPLTIDFLSHRFFVYFATTIPKTESEPSKIISQVFPT